ncbi:long-chain fatty acid--CoA ligase [Robertkochia marina]|uniref:Long-chain fatty acid--CoA ligase n=1 Tax=Robertkochia marina TaxID=1227945 RepID=A0A4S3LZC6_9FLAO|nr:AMP-dependent synthetase/ligase [Robertkochia marina]THD67441.1 long-chain fatty acid--CoA ligase [Robertkochia marina]TRZ44688.1 long-chain fatty acid--CoA ligase [Robertkochia marina]
MTNVTRIFDFPQYQLKNHELKVAFCTKYNEKWVETSTKEFIRLIDQFSRGLLNMGVKAGDKIAVISSTNRTEWHIADYGILQAGAVNVPIYPTISEEDYAYILNHSESTYCIVSDQELLTKVNSIKDQVASLKEVYTFDEIEGAKNYKEILETGKNEANQKELDAIKAAVKPEDLATIIYTSGTTGKPKGVMLSHNNIVSNVKASDERVPLSEGDKALSFLPICHIFERMVTYLYQYCGISIYFAESIEKISDNLKEVRPEVMTVVPRLLEKVYDKIYAKGAELTGIKRNLFFWAIELGKQYEPYNANGAWYEFKLSIARKLIFSKWQEGLGGNLKILVSGSAALQPTLARVFGAAGMPVMEGYGLTETSPVIAVNDQNNRGWKIGSVGRIVSGVEVKIAEDGEILCKGPNVMMGYYKDPERTADVMTGDYFHTGDIGEIDQDGFLKITDRKKEMFKTSGGKYVAPQLIENDMKQSRFIEQIMVVGEGEKMPAALIQPAFEFVEEWARRHNYQFNGDHESMIKDQRVIDRIQEEVDHYNERFGKWEKIKKFELTPDVWTIDGGHLTPTMKLKRKVIKEKYISLYNRIYDRES